MDDWTLAALVFTGIVIIIAAWGLWLVLKGRKKMGDKQNELLTPEEIADICLGYTDNGERLVKSPALIAKDAAKAYRDKTMTMASHLKSDGFATNITANWREDG